MFVKEVKTEEKVIFKHMQRNSFSDVVKTLQRLDQSQSLRQMTSELENLKTPKSIHKINPLLVMELYELKENKKMHQLSTRPSIQ